MCSMIFIQHSITHKTYPKEEKLYYYYFSCHPTMCSSMIFNMHGSLITFPKEENLGNIVRKKNGMGVYRFLCVHYTVGSIKYGSP